MSKIAYDPVKDRFASLIRRSNLLRTLFYFLLDLFFLRSWYVREILRRQAGPIDQDRSWRLLDAGCGFGQYDRFILRDFGRVTVKAVDVKESYLEDCRHYFQKEIGQGRITFEKVDLLQYNEAEVYDFVLCVDVLEHIEEDERVLANLYRSLAPGGFFLMHSPSVYAEEDAGEDDTFVGEHARTGYSKSEIKKKLETAGFAPVNIAYTYGHSGHAAWELLIKRPMLWLTKYKLWVLPLLAVYLLFTLPAGLVLMKRDMGEYNEKGTGIYALAQKK